MTSFTLTLRRAPRVRVPIHLGPGVLERLVRDVREAFAGRTSIVISDSHVAPLHGRRLRSRLEDAGLDAHLLEFEAGERSKTRETKARLEDALSRLEAGRHSVVVALGGGVVGDLAGFVAATWHRGVPVVQAPTSVLAMADAALGGKTAVDLPGGKNLVGAFHQPWGIYADLETLDTLPDAEFRRGLSEVVKAGVIADARLFARLERRRSALLRRDPALLESCLGRCLRIKGRVVAADPEEVGLRAVLNFGHTIAHAIELCSDWTVPHADAVALGMIVEARLATATVGFPAEEAERVARLLGGLGFEVSLTSGLDPDAIVDATRRDKKARGGRPRFALPRALGLMGDGGEVTTEVDPATVREALASAV